MHGTEKPQRTVGNRVHTVKEWAPYFEDLIRGLRPWELRWREREYRAGDTLVVVEHSLGAGVGLGGFLAADGSADWQNTGRSAVCRIDWTSDDQPAPIHLLPQNLILLGVHVLNVFEYEHKRVGREQEITDQVRGLEQILADLYKRRAGMVTTPPHEGARSGARWCVHCGQEPVLLSIGSGRCFRCEDTLPARRRAQ